MSLDLSRRSLLGLIAAAPVAAVAQPGGAAYLTAGFEAALVAVGIDPSPMASGWVIREGEDFSLIDGPAGRRIAVLNPDTVTSLATLPDSNHLPEGLSRSPSDEGSDARRCDRSGPTLPSCPPAVASGPELSRETIFLQHARAC